MKITVVGAGYVGLVTGVSLAARHEVTFVEMNPERISELSRGRMPIEEPGLGDAFHLHRERIVVVDALDRSEAPDLVFVCVATPIGEGGESDLQQISSGSTSRSHGPTSVSAKPSAMSYPFRELRPPR